AAIRRADRCETARRRDARVVESDRVRPPRRYQLGNADVGDRALGRTGLELADGRRLLALSQDVGGGEPVEDAIRAAQALPGHQVVVALDLDADVSLHRSL